MFPVSVSNPLTAQTEKVNTGWRARVELSLLKQEFKGIEKNRKLIITVVDFIHEKYLSLCIYYTVKTVLLI